MSDCSLYNEVKNGGTKIAFPWREIGNEDAKQIAKALIEPHTIVQTLDLTSKGIGVEGTRAIAEALKTNSKLQQRRWEALSNHTHVIIDCGAIAEAFHIGSKLQQLKFGLNSIGVEGGIAMAEALKIDSTLQQL